jgi:tetratricopeptide (TPR) repeat protein
MLTIDWNALEDFSSRLSQPGLQLGTIPDDEWKLIEKALISFSEEKDWQSIVKLRKLFDNLFASDTLGGYDLLQELDQKAIEAARQLDDKAELAHLLDSRGHNYHRQGYHSNAIEAFDESAKLYRAIGKDFLAIKSFYMTSLCHRALGDRDRARKVLNDVIQKIDPNDAWLGQPLQVLAWLARDEGKSQEAEKLLWQALELHKELEDSDMLVAGTLADLGEIISIQGRTGEAKGLFEQSLSVISGHGGQYDRQEARTLLKYSETLMYQKDYSGAIKFLNLADTKASRYGHYYDLLWQIELAKAFILLRQRDFKNSFYKLRSVFRIRKYLDLPGSSLILHISRRYLKRVTGWIARSIYAK